MNKKDRIKQYQKALNFYKRRPNGEAMSIAISFFGLCDVFTIRKPKCDKLHELKEFYALEPKNHGLFWWADSKHGVKTRIKKLKLMIKMAKKATE